MTLRIGSSGSFDAFVCSVDGREVALGRALVVPPEGAAGAGGGE